VSSAFVRLLFSSRTFVSALTANSGATLNTKVRLSRLSTGRPVRPSDGFRSAGDRTLPRREDRERCLTRARSLARDYRFRRYIYGTLLLMIQSSEFRLNRGSSRSNEKQPMRCTDSLSDFAASLCTRDLRHNRTFRARLDSRLRAPLFISLRGMNDFFRIFQFPPGRSIFPASRSIRLS